MNSYNGFSPEQRNRAQRWLNEQWKAGRLKKPDRCCACRQTIGIFDAHAEDYSEPFAQGKTDQFPLCFRCHMMVHCRFRNQSAWHAYRAMVADGWVFAPLRTRNFGLFCKQTMDGMGKDVTKIKLCAPGTLVLDGIDRGLYLPKC